MMFDVAKAFASISSAPFDGSWSEALAQVSTAGGGWAGQLLGISRAGEVLYDIGHRIPLEALIDFERRGCVDPALNPRAAVLKRPHFETVGDDQVMSADERRRSPFYAELYEPVDAPFVCMSRLPGPQGSSIVVSSLRSASAGHVADEDRLRFSMLLPHLAAAFRLQARLDGHGQSVALGALDAVALPAFLLSASGRLVGLTASAESLAQEAGVVQVRRRRIHAMDRCSDARLQAAIRLACSWSAEPMVRGTSVVVRGDGGGVTTAEVAPLPSASAAARHGAVAVVTFPELRVPARSPGLDELSATVDSSALASAVLPPRL